MEENVNEKEVYFGKFCGVCKYGKLSENEEPCEECLSTPMMYNSHKPLKFEKGVGTNGGKRQKLSNERQQG